jgi:CBS domain-containing protein
MNEASKPLETDSHSTPPEHAAAAAAAVRAAPPVPVSSIAAVTQARLVTVQSHALLAAVAGIVLKAHIDMVVVCDAAGSAEGVVTETVLIHQLAFGNADVFTTRASEVMLRDFNTCRPSDLLTDTLALMQSRRLAHVLVMEADRIPLGVLNVRDGLRALLAAGNYEEALLRNYVMGVGYQ